MLLGFEQTTQQFLYPLARIFMSVNIMVSNFPLPPPLSSLPPSSLFHTPYADDNNNYYYHHHHHHLLYAGYLYLYS